MAGKVIVIGPKKRENIPSDAIFVNTTSRSDNWSQGLSPFLLGPCPLYGEYVSKNVENAWQYSKVYSCHVGEDGEPTETYWKWAVIGWNQDRANRYPMGKSKKPVYSYWNGRRLGYIEARSKIYVPLYSKAVRNTKAYGKLKQLYQEGNVIYLWDFDGYNYEELGMSLKDVLNCPNKKMGHAFVLAAMLEKDR